MERNNNKPKVIEIPRQVAVKRPLGGQKIRVDESVDTESIRALRKLGASVVVVNQLTGQERLVILK